MSLRGKLVAFIIGAVALIQLAWGLSMVRSDAKLLEREANLRSRAILHAIAAPAALYIATREFESLDTVLDVYAKRSSGDTLFHSIAVLGTNGVIIAHTDPREYGRTMSGSFPVKALSARRSLSENIQTERGRVTRISMPVISGLRWGTIIAETSMLSVDDRVMTNKITVLLSTFLIAGSTAILIWTLLNHMVFLPLESFARTSRAIGRGDFTARITVPKTKDELAVLGNTMNEMTDRLADHSTHLELTVASRTQELQDANQSLAQVNRDLASAVEELARLARTDGLTQLNNHRTFQERIVQEVRRSERSQSPLTILMIDVDHFKTYNDTHGHPAGDKVLKTLAKIMMRSLRNTDVIARYGGEEFAIILVDTPLSFAAKVADKVRTAVRQEPFKGAATSQPGGRMTVSIGMAGWPIHGKTAQSLVEAADKALYDAKRAGRDQVKMAGSTV